MRLRREVVVRIILRSREKNPLILSLLAECKCLHRRHSPLQRPPSHIHRWPGATTTIIVNDSRECFDKTWAFRKQQERTGEKTLLFSAAWSLCCVRGWVSVIYCAVMKDAVWRRPHPPATCHAHVPVLINIYKVREENIIARRCFSTFGRKSWLCERRNLDLCEVRIWGWCNAPRFPRAVQEQGADGRVPALSFSTGSQVR